VIGRMVVVVSWLDGSKLQVAGTGPAYPLRADFKGHNNTARMVVSEYNVPVDIAAPPDAIDAPQRASRTRGPRPPPPRQGRPPPPRCRPAAPGGHATSPPPPPQPVTTADRPHAGATTARPGHLATRTDELVTLTHTTVPPGITARPARQPPRKTPPRAARR